MSIKALQIFAIFCIIVGVPSIAIGQDDTRAVPESKAQMTMSFSPVVKKTAPAVVNIYTKRIVQQRINPFMSDPLFQQFFGNRGMQGLTREQVESALGSGVIIQSDGLIVTNAHVVKDAQEIMVVLSDRREFAAKLSIIDERSDIALLRIDGKGEDLPHASLKLSDDLEVGDIVIAIGNPFGVGQTVTSGIVSALARSSLNINDFNFFIQTDAAINPGNSGGPLVDMNGGVVGINSAIYSRGGGSLGIGFAVPSEMVATVIAAEKTNDKKIGKVTRAWLGISGQQVTSDIAQSLGLKRPAGVLINNIHPVSPLLKEGIKVGDVVTSVNGRAINDLAELKFRFATLPLGEVASLNILRKGDEKIFKVKAMAPPDSPVRDEQKLLGNHVLNGASVANINPAVNVEMNLLNREDGVVVLSVDNDKSAVRLLQAGDIILDINGVEISSVKDLKKILTKLTINVGFAMTVERGGQKTRIVIR